MMTDCARGRDSWADASEVSFRKSHVRTKQAKHARFQRRFDAGKISWKGDYIGYLNHTTAPVVGSSGNSISAINVDGTANNTSAYVDADANVDAVQWERSFTSATVDDLNASADISLGKDDQIMALKRRNDLLSQGNRFLASKVDMLKEQTELLEARVEQIADLRRENHQLYGQSQQLVQQLQRAEEALGAWMTHASQLEDNHCNSWGIFDEARVAAIEKAIVEVQERVQDHPVLDLDAFYSQLSDFHQANMRNTEQLVKALQSSVQQSVTNLQDQLDYVKEHVSFWLEDDTGKWYDTTSLQALSIPATDVIFAESTGVDILRSDGSWAKTPGQDERDAVCDQHHTNNVVFKRPVQREGGNDAGYDQLQNNVVGDGHAQRGPDKNDAGCDQLQNNVVDDRPVQRYGGNGSAECHQLQRSHSTILSRPDGSWAKSPGREFAISECLANAIRCSGYDWLHVTCNQWDSYSLFHAPQGKALYGGEKTSKGKLSAEEMRVIQMSEAEWDEKEASDRHLLLLNLFPGIDSEQGDTTKFDNNHSKQLTIGTRVCLRGLNTKHLNGMSGMVAGVIKDGRCSVQLEDGTTRKFHTQNIFASALKLTSNSQLRSSLQSGVDAEQTSSEDDEGLHKQ